MQLRKSRNTNRLGNDSNRDQTINDGDLSAITTFTEGADISDKPAPGKKAKPSLMSMTNLVINANKAVGIHYIPGLKKNGNLFDQKDKPAHDNRLLFNVCGEKYEVLESTVQRYPNTLLADSSKRETLWDEKHKEFYLDRNRACFESVLTYYQSHGILIRPQNIPDVLFLRELQFYELGEEVLQKVRGNNNQQTKGKTTDDIVIDVQHISLQTKVWDLFEYPETSTAARIMAWFSCTVVLFSIVLFCIETLPRFKEKDDSGQRKGYKTFFILESVCIAWFTFEYLTRLISSPNKWRFLKEALNVIDLVAILPYFLNFALSGNANVSSVAILRAVRLVRVFRVFKLSRYCSGLRILGQTLRASISELGLLVFFLTVDMEYLSIQNKAKTAEMKQRFRVIGAMYQFYMLRMISTTASLSLWILLGSIIVKKILKRIEIQTLVLYNRQKKTEMAIAFDAR